MTTVRRGTLVSFSAAAWTALVLLDGADFEAQMQVGVWVQAQMLTANADVAVLVFGGTNTDDGVVLGPYGALGLQDLHTTAGPLFDHLNLGAATTAPSGGLAATQTDTGAASVPNIIQTGHNTSAAPAAGFGSAILHSLQDSTTPDTAAAYDQVVWVDPTHATRKARRLLTVYDTAQREIIRLEASGSAGLIGFLGAAAVARASAYTQTYATTARTHANPTAATPSAYAAGANGYSTAAKAQEMRDQIAALVADVANTKQVLNALIDDLQALGLVG